jgi:hypothetical protein
VERKDAKEAVEGTGVPCTVYEVDLICRDGVKGCLVVASSESAKCTASTVDARFLQSGSKSSSAMLLRLLIGCPTSIFVVINL